MEEGMTYEEFLATVRRHGGPGDNAHADQASRIVLASLGKRLAGGEPRDLASQLPQELQDPLLAHTGAAETSDDLDEFLRRVAEKEGYGCSPEQARSHARAVLGTITEFVSQGELEDLRAQLPAGYATLFERAA
jgi:uncharacterized protein (DUF2267 family)